jgi:hypothetical protein
MLVRMDTRERISSPHLLSQLTARDVVTAEPPTLLDRILRSPEGWKEGA